MTQDTIYIYDNGTQQITFSRAPRQFWITKLSGVSDNAVTVSETQGVGQVGATLGSMSVQPRDITVNGCVFEPVEDNRAALLACVLPGVLARFIVAQAGKAWYLEGTPKKTPDFSDSPVVQDFQFSFHCPYPYWRTTEEASAMLAGIQKLFKFPFNTAGVWFISQYTASAFHRVLNEGNIATAFEVTLRATAEVDTPEIWHVERGTYLRINKVMAAGESIKISTVYGHKGVTLQHTDGDVENGFRYLDVDSDLNMELTPGVNTLRYAAAQNREGLIVTLQAPKGVLVGV